jgi:hypothetical protein
MIKKSQELKTAKANLSAQVKAGGITPQQRSAELANLKRQPAAQIQAGNQAAMGPRPPVPLPQIPAPGGPAPAAPSAGGFPPDMEHMPMVERPLQMSQMQRPFQMGQRPQMAMNGQMDPATMQRLMGALQGPQQQPNMMGMGQMPSFGGGMMQAPNMFGGSGQPPMGPGSLSAFGGQMNKPNGWF